MRELLRLNDSLMHAATQDAFENSLHLQKAISMLFIDVDHCKQVNDIYGHAFGDCILTRISEIITACLRDSDLSCRYGGEEFVVLLDHADCHTAQIVASRIMDKTRQTRFALYPDFHVSISIGVVGGIPTTMQNLNDWIRVRIRPCTGQNRTGATVSFRTI